jgi:anti-sigma B factor antagonist
VSRAPETEPTPAEDLHLVEYTIGRAVVVKATGEIDVDSAPQLRTAITAALATADGGPCITDLTSVTFLGSAGLSALLQAANEADTQHQTLRIVVDGNRPVVRPLEITGLDHVLRLYHSVDEALHSSRSS